MEGRHLLRVNVTPIYDAVMHQASVLDRTRIPSQVVS